MQLVAHVVKTGLIFVGILGVTGCVSVVSSRDLTLATDVRANLSVERTNDEDLARARLAMRTTGGDWVKLAGERVQINGVRLRWTDDALYSASVPVADEYRFVLTTAEGHSHGTDLGHLPEWQFADERPLDNSAIALRGPCRWQIRPNGKGDVSLHVNLSQQRGTLGRVYSETVTEDTGYFELDPRRKVRTHGDVSPVFRPGPARLCLERIQALQTPLAGFARSEVELASRRVITVELEENASEESTVNTQQHADPGNSRDIVNELPDALVSPDGRFVAVPHRVPETEGGGVTAIFERSPEGLRSIGAVDACRPMAWSPCVEGVLLLHSADDGDACEVYLVDVEDEMLRKRRIYQNNPALCFVSWSNDDVLTLSFAWGGDFDLKVRHASTDSPELTANRREE